MDEEEFKLIVSNVQDFWNSSQVKYGVSEFGSSSSNSELEEILNPMIDNGETILEGVQGAIYQSDFYKNMTSDEQASLHEEIDYLSDQQLVELSLTFNAIYYSENIAPSQIGIDDIMSCLTVATGIVAIRDLYLNTISGGSVASMLGALKHIGRRYLGWIGVAAMVYEFGNCIYDRY